MGGSVKEMPEASSFVLFPGQLILSFLRLTNTGDQNIVFFEFANSNFREI